MSSSSMSGQERQTALNRELGCAFLFALPFVLFGLYSVYLSYLQVAGWWETQDWSEQPAVIRSVDLQERRDSRGSTTYSVSATYEYRVGEKSYTGDRVWLVGGRDNIGDFYQRVYRELNDHWSQGRTFRCYVDSDDPTSSILYRDPRWGLLAFKSMLMLVFGGVGAVVLWGLRRQHARVETAAIRSDQHPHEPWKWDESLEEGRYHPTDPVFIIVLACLAMNGVGWGLVWYLSGRVAENPWIVSVGILPLAGLLLLVPTGRAIRKWFTFGSPELEVTPWPLCVGDEATLRLVSNSLPPEGTTLRATLKVTPLQARSKISAKEAYAAAKVGQDGEWMARIQLPPGVPRSPAVLDVNKYNFATWTITVSDPSVRHGFEVTYVIQVFDSEHGAGR